MNSRSMRLAAALFIVAAGPLSAGSTVFTVVNTNDSGNGSLRAAIANANNTPTPLIDFDIPGAGVHTIAPLSPLPALTASVTIDGYTQPGASPNTLADGNDAVLLIEIDGTNLGFVGIDLQGGGSTVRGLVVNRVPGTAVQLAGTGGPRRRGQLHRHGRRGDIGPPERRRRFGLFAGQPCGRHAPGRSQPHLGQRSGRRCPSTAAPTTSSRATSSEPTATARPHCQTEGPEFRRASVRESSAGLRRAHAIFCPEISTASSSRAASSSSRGISSGRTSPASGHPEFRPRHRPRERRRDRRRRSRRGKPHLRQRRKRDPDPRAPRTSRSTATASARTSRARRRSATASSGINSQFGFVIPADNRIGGLQPGEGNIIAFNGSAGIVLSNTGAHLHPPQQHLSKPRDQRRRPRHRPRPRRRHTQRRRRRRLGRERPAQFPAHPLGRVRPRHDPDPGDAAGSAGPDFRHRLLLELLQLPAARLSAGRELPRPPPSCSPTATASPRSTSPTPSRSPPAPRFPRPRPTPTTTLPSSRSRSSSRSRPPRARRRAARRSRSRARTSTRRSRSRSADCPRRTSFASATPSSPPRRRPCPPGSLNDVVAVNPDTTTGTLLKGWVADFLDVPASNQFHDERDAARLQRRHRRLRRRQLLRRQPHDPRPDGGVPDPGAPRLLLLAAAGHGNRLSRRAGRRTSTPPGSRSSSARA